MFNEDKQELISLARSGVDHSNITNWSQLSQAAEHEARQARIHVKRLKKMAKEAKNLAALHKAFREG